MRPHVPADRWSLLAIGHDQGLSEVEADLSRARFGSNRIAEEVPPSLVKTLRSAATDPMLWFLLVTSGLFVPLGQITDAVVLLAAIVPLLGMDFVLHRRTQASIEGLSSVLASEATVLRGNMQRRISADEVVAGDLVVVAQGESMPADGIVVTGEDLQVDESSLTGEAFPIAKHAHCGSSIPAEEAWVFAGTRLLTGSAHVRILMVGTETLYGEVVNSVVRGPQGLTRLQVAVAGLVKVLLAGACAICLLLAGVRVWQGFGLADAFLSAATLAVAAIPEEFPVALTFFLAVGIYRLARRRALVRRAVAVENIGRTSAICSDKTGTITEGRLVFNGALPASGADAEWLMSLGALACRADSADPLDIAILAVAPSMGTGWVRQRVFPFTEGRRRECVIWSRPGALAPLSPYLIAAKGAPETILARCEMTDGERAVWLDNVFEQCSKGNKVLACCWLDAEAQPLTEPDTGFRFAGLLTVADPVRPGVIEAITEARGAGIQIVMVTGDHPATAAAVARQCGLADNPIPISGDQLEETLTSMNRDELQGLTVIARANPAQKVLIVHSLQREGRIVAVTGDGVNDTPALRAADVGIAMGLRGTRSAREVSQIVLMDDNFRTIVNAIREGRQLFENLRSSFAFLLMIHIPLVASAAIVPFLGYPLLYLPIHIVWLELLIHPAAILGFQKPPKMTLALRQDRSDMLFSGPDWGVILLTGAAITGVLLAVFLFSVQTSGSAEHGRAMALTMLTSSLGILLLLLSKGTTRAAQAVAFCAIASGAIFTQVPACTVLLHVHSLETSDWILAFAAGAFAALGAAFLPR